MNQEFFADYQAINALLLANREDDARDALIKLLAKYEERALDYDEVTNHFIREVGLYPYMREETSNWEDSFAKNLFEAEVGPGDKKVLHREQFQLLRALLDGKNIAVSAPTSFGKSFIVDAFITIKRPKNVVIIVPTIALMDETRRRIYKKFAGDYNIITTIDAPIQDKNIFIFPQERSFSYRDKIDNIDIFIVDEFYKSSKIFEQERAASLIRAIIEIGSKAKQRYYLAPNISAIKENQFTKDMEFFKLDFHTVVLNITDYYPKIQKENKNKSEIFLNLHKQLRGKTLIYAGSYSNIELVSNLILTNTNEINSPLLNSFSNWLGENYDYSWDLTLLVKRGVGIHNGALHRSLSQIQIKLFEENENGLNRLISTSSIIEGVNTSAQNVIVWKTTGRGIRFSNFSYKNLVGRAGRMFRHFIGNIFLLDKTPKEELTQLEIPFPDEILGNIDSEKHQEILTREQVAKIDQQNREMSEILGESFGDLKNQQPMQSENFDLLKRVAVKIKNSPLEWLALSNLNSSNVAFWDSALYKILRNNNSLAEVEHRKQVAFIKILRHNWEYTIPQMLEELDEVGIGINQFFKLERSATFKFASFLSDINVLIPKITGRKFDISPFIAKLSFAFLPPVVYQLEEFGLPRMISKKIQNALLFNFEDAENTLDRTLTWFHSTTANCIAETLNLCEFERYILDYFYDGITVLKNN